jgi:hypothetical protein
MKLASDFVPTVIVVVVLVLLAFWIVHESDKNNKEVIEAVRQAQAERQRQANATLEAIRERMGNEKLWQEVEPKINNEQ